MISKQYYVRFLSPILSFINTCGLIFAPLLPSGSTHSLCSYCLWEDSSPTWHLVPLLFLNSSHPSTKTSPLNIELFSCPLTPDSLFFPDWPDLCLLNFPPLSLSPFFSPSCQMQTISQNLCKDFPTKQTSHFPPPHELDSLSIIYYLYIKAELPECLWTSEQFFNDLIGFTDSTDREASLIAPWKTKF